MKRVSRKKTPVINISKKHMVCVIVAVLFVLSHYLQAQTPGYSTLDVVPVDTHRVGEIASMLTEQPKGFGDPIQRRGRWDELYKTGRFTSLLEEADSLASVPFPKLTATIYMSYYGGKDSETSKRFIMNRRMLLTKLVWAECLSNRGKYLPAIRNAVRDILNTVSWAFPAEDRQRTNYDGTLYTIGLSSSAYGLDMAQTLYLLNEKLGAGLQREILEALYLKVFNPTLNAVENNNANGEFVWLTNNGNYNAVTLAGVTGAALAVIPDRDERAKFVAIAERYSNNFIVGYSDDGYCSEGIGYYMYGFGHYLLLRECLWQATGGKIDLLERPKIEKIAAYVPEMEIINGIYPAIGDCDQYIKPDCMVMNYLDRNFSMGLKGYDNCDVDGMAQHALANLMYFFPNSAPLPKPCAGAGHEIGVRSYFGQAGVLVVRPYEQSVHGMGAMFKGGHNSEHHNHNDVGSFTIVVGDELLMGDAGLATYTPRYFSKERYDLYQTTASYGHPVPLVAGSQQQTGKEAKARILKTGFTEAEDMFVMDLVSCYAVPELQDLTRSFIYNRSQGGYVEVKDEFTFVNPQSFETALITRHGWQQTSDNEIVINGLNHHLRVEIHSTGKGVVIRDEIIDEGPMPYTRIAIKLLEPTVSGILTMKFFPDGRWMDKEQTNIYQPKVFSGQ